MTEQQQQQKEKNGQKKEKKKKKILKDMSLFEAERRAFQAATFSAEEVAKVNRWLMRRLQQGLTQFTVWSVAHFCSPQSGWSKVMIGAKGQKAFVKPFETYLPQGAREIVQLQDLVALLGSDTACDSLERSLSRYHHHLQTMGHTPLLTKQVIHATAKADGTGIMDKLQRLFGIRDDIVLDEYRLAIHSIFIAPPRPRHIAKSQPSKQGGGGGSLAGSASSTYTTMVVAENANSEEEEEEEQKEKISSSPSAESSKHSLPTEASKDRSLTLISTNRSQNHSHSHSRKSSSTSLSARKHRKH